MVKFTSVQAGNSSQKQIAFELNNKMIDLECDLHPFQLSVISVSLEGNEIPTYTIESVCCDKFRPVIELYLDRHK
jgi:hypothetical protein